MALTKISTDGVKDDAITKAKIPADQIEASELADNAVDTNAIADQAVALSKLPHGDGSSDGKFLRANNGADPSFETVSIPAGTTINNNADNRVITGSGTANTLEGEAGLTYNGQKLGINTVTAEGSAIKLYDTTSNSQVWYVNGEGNSFQGHIYPRTDSNLDLGYHATNKWRDVVISGGIRYGNASDANYLDDYEEGTFTPQMHDGNSSNVVLTGTNCLYTKVGRMVNISGQITLNDTGKSGILVLTHLPFNCNSVDQLAAGSWWMDRGTGNDTVGGVCYKQASNATMRFTNPTAVHTNASGDDAAKSATRYLEFSQWQNGKHIYFNLTYNT